MRRWDVVAAGDPNEVEALLDLGWEPYAVYPDPQGYTVHWLRRELELSVDGHTYPKVDA